MGSLTRSNLASRRDERRERFEAKHHPEVVFEPTEDQALAIDRAGNDLKASPAYFDARNHFALEQQNRGAA
jgi:hypothetical protein